MKNLMRKFLGGWTIAMLALIPFSRPYYGIPWSVFAAILTGAILAVFWNRFPEYERRQKLQEAASKQAMEEVAAEFGRRAMWTRLWGPVILFSVLGFILMIVSIHLFDTMWTPSGVFAVVAMIGVPQAWMYFSPIDRKIVRRSKELYKASLNL